MAMLQLALAAAAAAVGAMATSETMGPAAFFWPPDRAWSAQTDNTPPCGSVDGVTNRTAFPLTGGRVALTAQDDSYNVSMAVAFTNDPRSQADFKFVFNPVPIRELDPGHTCFNVADPPPGAAAPGTNATIQLQYTADFDSPGDKVFYACADITYVRASDGDDTFTAGIPCFNATDDRDVPAPTASSVPTDLPGHGDNAPPLTVPSDTPQGGGGGLSKGAIAGIVIGTVLGTALVAGLALLLYRERKKKNRLVRQRDSARGVRWTEDPAKDSVSAGSFRLQNLGPQSAGP